MRYRYMLMLACLILLFSCEKDISSTADLIDAHLSATSPHGDWQKVTSQSASYILKTLINGQIVSDENKVISQLFPDFQKTVSFKNDTMSNIILTNSEGSKMVRFDKGSFFGVNSIPREEIQISHVLNLKNKLDDYKLIDSTWMNRPVFFVSSQKRNDSYIFDKQSNMLIAYLSISGYGKSILTLEDYQEVDGYLLPYKYKIDIPDANYAQEFIYQERIINPDFPENHFKLNKEWKSLEKGSLIPSFELPMAFDKRKVVAASDLRGKVILIDFWATWCKPCLEELPTIKEQYFKYKDKGFEVVSISIDSDKKRLESFLRDKPFPWNYSLYSAGEFNSDLARNFQLVTLPKPILIDRELKIIAMDDELRGGKLAIILKDIFSDKNE